MIRVGKCDGNPYKQGPQGSLSRTVTSPSEDGGTSLINGSGRGAPAARQWIIIVIRLCLVAGSPVRVGAHEL